MQIFTEQTIVDAISARINEIDQIIQNEIDRCRAANLDSKPYTAKLKGEQARLRKALKPLLNQYY